jgi:NIMA-interacting peptidyl-prolyl cis-trans isomerase 1
MAVETSPETGLPTGWEIRISTSKHLPYYFNPSTSESRWEPPESADTDKLKQYMAANFTGTSRLSTTETTTASGNGAGETGKIRAAHLLIKHRESRRPASWREAKITRTKEEARGILEEHEKVIQSGEKSLGDIAMKESDCSSARARGDL